MQHSGRLRDLKRAGRRKGSEAKGFPHHPNQNADRGANRIGAVLLR